MVFIFFFLFFRVRVCFFSCVCLCSCVCHSSSVLGSLSAESEHEGVGLKDAMNPDGEREFSFKENASALASEGTERDASIRLGVVSVSASVASKSKYASIGACAISVWFSAVRNVWSCWGSVGTSCCIF